MAVAAKISKYRYRVDTSDVIIWVDTMWLAFARENGAPQLTEQAVVGRLLWDFVAGAETQQLFMQVHERIRSSGKTIVLPFRCDSAALQRHMRMTISNQEHGHLLYECQLVRAVPQRAVGLLNKTIRRSGDPLWICSCCKRTLLPPLGWLDLEDVSVRLHLFEAEVVPPLHHTVCPSCASSVAAAGLVDNGSAA